jgi:TetR/AcrR family transcriptional repressor of lmrAB and yxaGH operons
MAPHSGTRERMIEGAKELVRVHGFTATSFKDVWEHTQTPRGSVYFHFPGGKEELGLEVVASSRQALVALTHATGAETRTPATLMRRLAKQLADQLEASGYSEGCPVAAVALEMSSTSPALRAAAADAFAAWADAIAAELQRKGVARGRAGKAAELAVVTLEGALLVSKTRGDRAPLDRAGALLAGAATGG